MIIWSAMIVPIITAVVLYMAFAHKTMVLEFVIPFVASAMFIFCSKGCVETTQTSDVEYWGGYVHRAEYYEDWNERVSCRHPIYCTRTVRSSDGETRQEEYVCGHWHSYDVDYHHPYWVLRDTLGGSHSISQASYEEMVVRWGNSTFEELNRNYHDDDGDRYFTLWDQHPETIEAVTAIHRYENRVQAADSTFSFQEVDPAGLYEYPSLRGHNNAAVLGDAGPDGAFGIRALDYLNSTLGTAKQIRLWVLIFKNGSLSDGLRQENLWKGGNKNELVITVGVDDDYAVVWSHVFSWTDAKTIVVEARNLVVGQAPLHLGQLAKDLEPLILEKWVRKNFADFSYLTVEPPTWAVLLVFALTIILNLGISAWVVLNEWEEPWSR